MATDYGNYSTDLSKLREDYSSTNQKLKNNYDESLKNISDTYEKREKNQQAINSERLNNLSEQNTDQYVNLSKKSAEKLAQKQKEFTNSLRTNGEQFDTDRKVIKETLEEKLARAKEAFNQSIGQMKESNQLQAQEKDKNFSTTLAQTRNNAEEKIHSIQKNNEEAFADYRQDMTKQKKDLNQKFLAGENEQYKRLHNDADKKADYFNSKINEITKNHDESLRSLNEKHDSTSAKNKREHRDNLEYLDSKNQAYTKELINDFQDKFAKQAEQSKEDLAKEVENTQKNKETYTLETNKKLNGNQNLKNLENEGQKKIIRDGYDRRLENLRKQMITQEDIYNKRSLEGNNNALQELKAVEQDNKKKMMSSQSLHDAEVTQLKDQAREMASSNIEQYNAKLADVEKDNELRLTKEKHNSKDQLTSTQDRHQLENDRIAALNLSNLERIQSEAQKERTSLKENAKRELSNNITQVKQDYQKRFDKTMEGYQQKIEQQEKALEQIQTGTSEKISSLQENTDKKLEGVLNQERSERELEKQAFATRFSELKDSYERKFKDQKKQFDKELEKTRRENSNLVTNLAKKNNEQVQTLMETHMREMKRASDELRSEKNRNFKTANLEKEQIIERYENKIEEIKSAYDNDRIKTSEERKVNA